MPFGATWSETISMRYIAAVLEVNANLTFQLDAVSKMIAAVDFDKGFLDQNAVDDQGGAGVAGPLSKATTPQPSPRRSLSQDFTSNFSCHLTAPEVSRIASTSSHNLAGLLRSSAGGP